MDHGAGQPATTHKIRLIALERSLQPGALEGPDRAFWRGSAAVMGAVTDPARLERARSRGYAPW
jgi:hypothetical protein